MDPLTPLDTLCRIILRAREYEAQTDAAHADAAGLFRHVTPLRTLALCCRYLSSRRRHSWPSRRSS